MHHYTPSDPAPQPELPPPCPPCGHRPAPYDQRLFNLMDWVLLLESVVHDLKRATEEAAR
jgi:hypothetical protein